MTARKPKTKRTLKFVSKGQTNKSTSQKIIDHGKICDLNYKIYSRGVIHITDGKLLFKKDPDLFEEAIEKIDFNKIKENDSFLIEGSGDNDDLELSLKDGELKLSLKKKGFDVLNKLKNLINKGKRSKKS